MRQKGDQKNMKGEKRSHGVRGNLSGWERGIQEKGNEGISRGRWRNVFNLNGEKRRHQGCK